MTYIFSGLRLYKENLDIVNSEVSIFMPTGVISLVSSGVYELPLGPE